MNNDIVTFLLPLYSGDEVWEAIWNQTHLGISISVPRDYITLKDLTIRYAQIIGVGDLCCLTTYRTVSFCT